MAKKLQVFGNRGKSAYQYALDGGYTGSEAEFKEKMARELEVSYDYEDLNNKILATGIRQMAMFVLAPGAGVTTTDSAAVPIVDLSISVKDSCTDVTITFSDNDNTNSQSVTIPVPITDEGLKQCKSLTMYHRYTSIKVNRNSTLILTYIADPVIYIDNLVKSLG